MAIPFCGAATSHAAEPSQVINDQLQLGDVFSTQTLDVQDADEGVSAAASAVGNIVSATGQNGGIDARSDQAVAGRVEAAVGATVRGASGPYFATSADATGNSATLGTCCGPTTGSSLQAIEQGGVVSAKAVSATGGPAGSIQVDTSAIGNTTGWVQKGVGIESWTGQTNAGLTSAINTGTFARTDGNTGLSATAVANNVTGDIADAATDIGVGQDLSGPGANAAIDVTLGSGTDLQALASGVGNNVDVQVSGGEANMNVLQTSSAPVGASANVNVGSWTSEANVIAYGVGNSVILSNNGPYAGLWSDQTATGDVNVAASFTGGAGSTAYVSATAMGNAVSGYACSACGGVIAATNSQVSSGRVRSTGAVNITGRARSVTSESLAVGNSATYQVVGSGN